MLACCTFQVYHTLSKILKKKFGGDATLIGDEGGFAPPCDSRSGIELVMEAIETAGYAGKCTVGLDVAASEFKVKDSPAGEGAKYDLGMWDAASQEISSGELMEFYGTHATHHSPFHHSSFHHSPLTTPPLHHSHLSSRSQLDQGLPGRDD